MLLVVFLAAQVVLPPALSGVAWLNQICGDDLGDDAPRTAHLDCHSCILKHVGAVAEIAAPSPPDPVSAFTAASSGVWEAGRISFSARDPPVPSVRFA